MRNPAAQGRRDENHADIKRFYEELFCSVVDCSKLGFGCPDLNVGIANYVNDWVEVKTEAGHLEPSQIRFQRDWRGRKIVVVRTHADVIAHVQDVRERVSRGRK